MRIHTGLAALSGLAVATMFGGAAMAQGAVSLSKTYTENATTTITNTTNVNLSKEIDVSKDLSISGLVAITGQIEVSESAMATVDNKQIINDNDVFGGDFLQNLASAEENVLMGATGRVGLNIASGDNNAQDNATAIAAVGLATAGASSDAEIFAYQESFNNIWTGATNQLNESELLGSVLNGAAGDVGVNVATGAFNVQKNAMAVASVTGAAVLAEAAAVVVQQATFNVVTHSETQNVSSISGDVLGAASGNVGANLTAGSNNIQANALSISSVQ